jgi:aspartate/tyrosine/aromatic aminotransferase
VHQALEQDLHQVWQQVVTSYAQEISQLRSEYEQLRAAFEGQMEGYSQRLRTIWQAMRQDLSASVPDLDYYALPVSAPAQELGEGLYSSERDYLEQIEAYKQFQGKQG